MNYIQAVYSMPLVKQMVMQLFIHSRMAQVLFFSCPLFHILLSNLRDAPVEIREIIVDICHTGASFTS